MRAVALVLLLAAGAAQACSVCGQAAPENQWAYLVMTGILSLLPLGLMAGVATWVALRIRAAARADAQGQPADPRETAASPLAPSLDASRS